MSATLIFFVLSSLFYFFSYPGVENDLWGHLFFGKEILQGGKIPSKNLYSYTSADYLWINHEWLAEVIFYGLFHLFGSPGLILLKVTLGGAVIWILNLIIRKRVASLFICALSLVWTMAILSPGFNVRPQIFTYFLFATFLFLFYRCEEKDRTALYWIPLLTVFWVNLHGGFVAGLGALGLFSLWAMLRRGWNGEARLTPTPIFIPLTLSVLSLGLNPYGFDLLKFLVNDLLVARPITEWGSVHFFDFSFLEFKLALILAILFSLRGAPSAAGILS